MAPHNLDVYQPLVPCTYAGTNSNGESTVPSGLSGVVQITAGDWHTCAAKADGGLVCWGESARAACMRGCAGTKLHSPLRLVFGADDIRHIMQVTVETVSCPSLAACLASSRQREDTIIPVF